MVEERGKAEPIFVAQIFDSGGDLVAEVEKLLSVRRRTP